MQEDALSAMLRCRRRTLADCAVIVDSVIEQPAPIGSCCKGGTGRGCSQGARLRIPAATASPELAPR